MPQLIDFNPVIIGAVHIAQKNLAKGETADIKFIRHLFLNQIIHFNAKFRSKYGEPIICCDSGSWRKEVFPFYKANRSKGRAESPLDWELIFESIDTIRKELDEHFPYKVIKAERAEADDIIGILCKYFSENEFETNGLFEEPQKVMIVSGDKDFKQLQCFDNVEQYSPLLKKRVVERQPELYLREHIIRGDGGDGVPNILSDDDTFVRDDKKQGRIMTKKLDVWVTQEPEEFCTNDEMLRNYHRNRKMVDLINCIPDDIVESTLNSYNNANVADRSGLFSFFMKNQLKNLMKDIQNI